MPYANKESQRLYQKRWILQRRREWCDRNGPCLWCGSDEDLEVDHIDPKDKVVDVASLWSRSERVRAKELVKCQVLCKPCHYLKTVSEVDVPHGTNSRYKWGCRCSGCRAAHAAVNRMYR